MLTYLSPSLPLPGVGGVVPLRMSLPSRPSRPSSPFGPFRFPSFSHVPLLFTYTSPVAVLTYLSPSFPLPGVGGVAPLRMSLPSRPSSPLSPLVILDTTVAVTAGLVALFASVCVTRIFSPFTAAVSKVTDHTLSETVVVLTVPSGRVTVIVEPFSPLPVIVVDPSTTASTNASLDGTNPEFPTTVALISLLIVLFTSSCRAEMLCPFTRGEIVSTVHVPSVATSVVFSVPSGSVTVTVAPATPLPLITLDPS